MGDSQEFAVRTPHASVFFALSLPFGVSSGYIGVTLSYVLAQGGMPVASIAGLIGIAFLPQILKVLWAPLIDTTLSPKRWYAIGAGAAGAAILATSLVGQPSGSMALLSVLALGATIAASLCSMTVETFMANLDPHRQGRAAGWSQAGNFGGGGVGGGLGLYLFQHLHAHWVSGAVLGLICLACITALPLIEASERAGRTALRETFSEVVQDVWSVAKSRAGVLVLFLMLLPIGSGGMPWNSVAGEWKASADQVALTGGVVAGLVSAVAALLAGWVCDLIDRRLAYCLFGSLVAALLFVTAHLPATPAVWMASSLLYSALVAACFAAYSAVVLEVIGPGAAATKFNLMASVSNVPVALMHVVDGGLHDRYGSRAMFYGEAGLSVASALLFGLVAACWRPRTAASSKAIAP